MHRPVSSHLNITPRDLAIIDMVCDYAGCGISHIHQRLWPHGSAISACYRRLGRLERARYLRIHRLPALIPQGSGKALITPGTKAAAILSDRSDPAQLKGLGRKHEISAFFAEHHFAICDFRVALEEAADGVSGVSLDGWILESVLKRQPIRVLDINRESSTKPNTNTITLVPDGVFKLVVRAQERVAYLEMDMGTIAHSRLKQRLRGYLLLNRSVPELVPLFFVTTSAERVKNIVEAIKEQAVNLRCDPTTIFVTCRHDIKKNTLLTGPIWHRAGVSQPSAILPHARFQRQEDGTALFDRKPVVDRPRSAVA